VFTLPIRHGISIAAPAAALSGHWPSWPG
jgi:hypothetical protein